MGELGTDCCFGTSEAEGKGREETEDDAMGGESSGLGMRWVGGRREADIVFLVWMYGMRRIVGVDEE